MFPEMDDLGQQIGEFIHYWGFKRVHGRIWTHLFLAKQPLDAADLVRQMRISKALISISMRELLEYDVIQHAGRSARGTHLYRTNPDILSVILNVLRQREKRFLSRILSAQESLDRVSSEDKTTFSISDDRIRALGGLTSRAMQALEGLIALKSVDFGEWRTAFMTGEGSEGEPTGDIRKAAGGLSSVVAGGMASPKGRTADGPTTASSVDFRRGAPIELPVGRTAVGRSMAGAEVNLATGGSSPWMRR